MYETFGKAYFLIYINTSEGSGKSKIYALRSEGTEIMPKCDSTSIVIKCTSVAETGAPQTIDLHLIFG